MFALLFVPDGLPSGFVSDWRTKSAILHQQTQIPLDRVDKLRKYVTNGDMLKYALPVAFKVRPQMVYDMLRKRMAESLPFNTLLGIEITSIGDGVSEVRLPLRHELTNHIETMHASALFAVAEAASGAAMAGALAPIMATVRPVASSAVISFKKTAPSAVAARAAVKEPAAALRERFASEGKVLFDVDVGIHDESQLEVAHVTVSWHVAKMK